jgi:glycosyltransferase involved in cell wall biosynthesis
VRALLEGAPFLLHVGGAEPQKNQAGVLRAFGLLCRNPAFRHNLVLVGAAHLPDDIALEVTPRAALRILRVTGATRADVDALYIHCAAFLFPSLYEGFGLPVLEAMRAGAPVITSNGSALPEVAGDAALLVEPQDAEALANAVRRVLDDERVRVRLSEAGERRAREFTWARAAGLTRAVYRRAAGLP